MIFTPSEEGALNKSLPIFQTMDITRIQATYYAHELLRRRPSDDLDRLTASLQDAQVDLNPHQIDAALFAFQSPLSKGVILADEVGLGKTIEAGIVIAQKWAERNRQLLVICPANLRKQWSQELADKFFLPSLILEKKSFNRIIDLGNLNPFDQPDTILICSYQFAKQKHPYLTKVPWSLVVIDEAHRLRNVYKPTNKIANTIRTSLLHAPKILLTATPLQNTLLELYGLVSIIDEYTFGDLKSFKAQYGRVTDSVEAFTELKSRLEPICKRTLRRQVLEYIRFTNRIPLVEEFYPHEEEMELYDQVTEYLQRPKLYALPFSQRQLMTLILRKLLASSSFAISNTFLGMEKRLKAILDKQKDFDHVLVEELKENYDDFEGVKDDWVDDEEEDESDDDSDFTDRQLTPEEIEELKAEMDTLLRFHELARSIDRNSKGEKLIVALDKGFETLRDLGAEQKAIIFTESTRTQSYLKSILEESGYRGKLVLFNGSNNDPQSKEIYKEWLLEHGGTDRVTGSMTADKRQAIVDYFRNQATIMIATEAAAEGINLQFCSLVVNYDMPWNPQRIEQRIGRCHRYGQKFDVVVLNFLNKANAADIRVYELLAEKFNLFNGVFGASDEVLGAIGSGMDFEKRIAKIYQDCRTEEEIRRAFDTLQQELEPEIVENLEQTRQKLLEHFDEDVQKRLRVNLSVGRDNMDRFESMLWQTTQFSLNDVATFDNEQFLFTLNSNPFPELPIHAGPYKMVRQTATEKKTEVTVPPDSNLYRVGHPLAKRILADLMDQPELRASAVIDLSGSGRKFSVLDPFIGRGGWLRLTKIRIDSFDTEEHWLVSCVTTDGEEMNGSDALKLFSLPMDVDHWEDSDYPTLDMMNEIKEREKSVLLKSIQERNASFFNVEMDKLDKWAEDMKISLEREIKDLEAEIKLKRADSRRTLDLTAKIALQRIIKDLEHKRNEKRRSLFESQDEIDARKENLLNEIEKRLGQNILKHDVLFLRWSLI